MVGPGVAGGSGDFRGAAQPRSRHVESGLATSRPEPLPREVPGDPVSELQAHVRPALEGPVEQVAMLECAARRLGVAIVGCLTDLREAEAEGWVESDPTATAAADG